MKSFTKTLFACATFALLCFLVSPLFAQSAVPHKVSWMAPTANIDGTPISGPITYNVFKRSGTLTMLVRTTSALSTNQPALPGDCFSVSATVGAKESQLANEVCIAIPPAPAREPNKPTGLKVERIP